MSSLLDCLNSIQLACIVLNLWIFFDLINLVKILFQHILSWMFSFDMVSMKFLILVIMLLTCLTKGALEPYLVIIIRSKVPNTLIKRGKKRKEKQIQTYELWAPLFWCFLLAPCYICSFNPTRVFRNMSVMKKKSSSPIVYGW